MKTWLVVFIGGMLAFGSICRADIVVGSSGTEWQTWQNSSPSNNGGEFWDRTSWDGRRCNIGYWLTGNASGCGNSTASSGLPASEAPGELPFWGVSRGTNDPSFHFSTEGDARTATLRLEIAGDRNFNSFGWYDLGSPGTLHELFAGPEAPVQVTSAFSPVGSFGYYATTKSGSTYRTSGSKQQRFALFRQTPGGTAGTSADVYWLGFEDLPLGSGDRDYNDLVVRISEVPEPAAYLVLGLGLGIIYLTIRRRDLRAV